MKDFDHRALDPLIHAPARLAVMSLLAANDRVEFRDLREALELTDGNLATHMRKLIDAGYVRHEKRFLNNKPNTRYTLTRRGRDAFRQHVDTLATLSGVSS